MTNTSSPKKRFLIIEDDKIINSSLQRKLKNLGFEVEGCFDGECGLKLLHEKRYDCIVLDLLMPIKDGFAVLTERDSTKSALTPVYVLTSLNEEKRALATKFGAKKVFAKSEMSLSEVVEELKREVGGEDGKIYYDMGLPSRIS